MQTLNITLARTANGSVDVAASLEAAETAIHQYIAARETELETVSEAVAAVFDKNRGARLNMPYVTSATLLQLNALPQNFKALSDRVQSYIRENAGDAASGKLFAIGKGKGGGVLRHSDQPVKPEAK